MQGWDMSVLLQGVKRTQWVIYLKSKALCNAAVDMKLTFIKLSLLCWYCEQIGYTPVAEHVRLCVCGGAVE